MFHMLGKTGVLFTISSVNFELKQGKEIRAEYILRIPPPESEPISLSLSLSHLGNRLFSLLSLSLSEPFKWFSFWF